MASLCSVCGEATVRRRGAICPDCERIEIEDHLGVNVDVAYEQIAAAEYVPPQIRRLISADGAKEDVVSAFVEHVKSMQVDAGELQRAGVPTSVDGVLRWGGLTAEEIFDAVDLGFESAESYRPFSGSGLRADEAQALQRGGLRSWLEEGLTVNQAAIWMTTGLPPRKARPWTQRGFTPEDMRRWQAVGVSAATQAERWQRAGYSVSDVHDLRKAGVETLDSAVEWANAGIPARDVNRWTEAGFGPSSAEPWRRAGVDPSAAQRRAEAGLQPPNA